MPLGAQLSTLGFFRRSSTVNILALGWIYLAGLHFIIWPLLVNGGGLSFLKDISSSLLGYLLDG